MAGALVPTWRLQALYNGAPVPGAKLYTYLSGTNTPQTTWNNQGLSIQNANPVVADAAGLFPVIFLSPVEYRVRLTTALGVDVIPEQDHVSDFGQMLAVDLTASSGSGLVGFLQAGTGAVARTVQAELRQNAVTPQQFGAVADGATDDSAAFQRAINFASTSPLPTLTIPAGSYRLATTLTWAVPTFRMLGAGREQTILDYRGATQFLRTTVGCEKVEIGDLTIDLEDATVGCNGIDFRKGSNLCRVHDVHFKVSDHALNGIIIRGEDPDNAGVANGKQFHNDIRRISFKGNGSAMLGVGIYLFGADITDARCNSNTIASCSFNGVITGVKSNGQGNTVAGCAWDNCTVGWQITGNNVVCNLSVGNYYDAATTTPIKLSCTIATANVITSIADVNINDAIDITDDFPLSSGVLRFSIWSGNAQILSQLRYVPLTDLGSGQVYGESNGGFLSVRGGNSLASGYLLLSGRDYAGGANAVSDSGGVSAVMRDTAGAQYRIVKTDGTTFTVLATMDNSGNWALATGYQQMVEVTAPAAPSANGVRIYAQDNGGGKTQLMAKFGSGAAQQLAIEP